MKTFTVSAPGKLHLLGEHTVVYGKPAIIAAVNKRCYVTVTSRKDKKINITFKKKLSLRGGTTKQSHNNQPIDCEGIGSPVFELVRNDNFMTFDEIIDKTKRAQQIWEQYSKTNDISELKVFTADPFDFIAITIGEALLFYNRKFSSGFHISIRSDIPVGSGMGSSGALAVAIAGAISLFLGKKFDKEKINQIAFLVEQKKHGMPSGGDNTASCYGGLIWYQKKSDKEKIITPISYAIPKRLVEKFMIIQTGIPEESTGEMVTKVKMQKFPRKGSMTKFKSEYGKIFDEQEELVHQLLSVIKKEDEEEILRIIKKGEKNLELLGVVSESTKKLIRSIENAGGAAKICGAGGRKNASGIVLAFHKNPDMIKKISEQFGFSSDKIILGTEGVREEI